MFRSPLATALAPSQLINPDGIESAFVATGRFLLSLSAMLFLAYLFMLVGCAALAVTTGRRRARHRSPRSAYLRRDHQHTDSPESGQRAGAGASQAA